MRLLVCGGRDYHDVYEMADVLFELRDRVPDFWLVTGTGPGAESLAVDICLELWGQPVVEQYEPRGEGNPAWFEKNTRMLRDGKPDYVLAFPTLGRGTWDMVDKARKAGVTVEVAS